MIEILETMFFHVCNKYIDTINPTLKRYKLQMCEDGIIRDIEENSKTSTANDDSIEHLIMNDKHIHTYIKELCSKESSGSFAYIYLSYGLMLQMIRDKTGLDDDGRQLIEKAFNNKEGSFLLLSKEIESKNGKNEHEGSIEELMGTCRSIRNVLAHPSDIDLHCGDKTSVMNTLHVITRLMGKIQKVRVIRTQSVSEKT